MVDFYKTPLARPVLDSMTAEELLHLASVWSDLTPLENALANKLEELVVETGWDCELESQGEADHNQGVLYGDDT